MPEQCLFCRMVAGEIPVNKVAETEHCLAFRDIHPQAPQHIVVIPKAHFSSSNDVVDDLTIGRMARLAAKIAEDEGFATAGYRTVINTNRDGGQTVYHLHLHLLAGRQLHWPPG